MASYIIPKIGQKVKVNSLVWYRQYDSSLAVIRCDDFGFIEVIEYNGNGIRFSSYQDSDVVYYVYFPATPQAAPATIYCSYDDLIFNPCEELYFHQYLQPYMKPDELHKFVKRLLNNEYGRHNAERNDPLIKTVKTSEKEKSIVSTIDFRVKKIMHNGPATIVFWKDGTKTVVRLKEGDKYDQYAAFTAAVAKRLYGKTVKISEIVDQYSKDLKKIDIPEAPPRELSVEELKVAADKLGYRVSKKPKK